MTEEKCLIIDQNSSKREGLKLKMHPQYAKMTGKQCLMKKNKIHVYACCQDRILQALNLWTMNISLHTKIAVHFVFKKTLINI